MDMVLHLSSSLALLSPLQYKTPTAMMAVNAGFSISASRTALSRHHMQNLHYSLI